MSKNNKKVLTWSIAAVFLLFVIASFFIPKGSQAPGTDTVGEASGKLDSLAQCLKDKGAKFYGASWCSHCNTQKEMFGDSQKFLPYVECSTRDGKGQLKACADAEIAGYPTWVFPDGSRQSGSLSLEILSQKTGCPLPE